MRGSRRSVKMGPTLLDFLEDRRVESRKSGTQQAKDEMPPAKKEEELLQNLIELFERHLRCFKKEEVATTLGVSVALAIKLLNELVQIGVVKKRLNDGGELVYCPARG